VIIFLLFPFCSAKHQNKKWPYYKELIVKLKQDFKNQYTVLVAPGPKEIEEATTLKAKVVLDETSLLKLKH